MRSFRQQAGKLYRKIKLLRVLPLPPVKNHPTILFWCPEAAASAHLATLCSVADALRNEGYRPLFVRCFGSFERCYSMEVESFDYSPHSAQKKNLCDTCTIRSVSIIDKFGFETIDLRRVIDRALLDEVKTLDFSNLAQFSFRNRLFGKLALHDLIIRNKLTQYESLSDDLRVGHRQTIQSAVLAYLVVLRLCERYRLHAIIHYNEWSMAMAAGWASEDSNVQRFTISQLLANRRYNDVFKNYMIFQRWKDLELWDQWKDLPLTPERIEMVTDEIVSRMADPRSHVHSPRKSVGNTFMEGIDIPRDRKFVVAYTSSGHELLASQPVLESFRKPIFSFENPFPTQVAWLKALIEFVEKRNDIQLIIRVHPSEYIGQESDYHKILRDTFPNNTSKCRFVWANEGISSYDLAEQTSLALVSWSTLGTELSIVGVPVLAAFRVTNNWPDGGLIHYRENRQDYFDTLSALLKEDEPSISMENIVDAFRWFHFMYFQGVIDMTDAFPDRDTFFPIRAPKNRVSMVLKDIIEGGPSQTTRTQQTLRQQNHRAAKKKELLSVRSQLASIIAFCTVGDKLADYSSLGLTHDDNSIEFSLGSKIVRRRSPMVARLASLYEKITPEPPRLAAMAEVAGN